MNKLLSRVQDADGLNRTIRAKTRQCQRPSERLHGQSVSASLHKYGNGLYEPILIN